MMKTTGVNFTSSLRFSASAFCCLRNASRSVISVLSKWGNVRNHHPVTAQVGARDFLDTTQLHFFDFAKLAEVNLRPRQHARDTAASGSRRCGFSAFNRFFSRKPETSSRRIRPLRPVPFTFARLTPNSRAKAANQRGSRERRHRFQRIRFYLLLSQPAQRQA
ncbi:Uncharacterised protein [Klebsiella pneumoniae]|uniref:Uncharacterized protein n=1 Tax=Klebsiella pneumoniae TaxID=573 RepID=A0A3S4KI26_KLEPN|nr:Uncharacterised protein [Klebsiella pneumoniae]